MSYSVMKADLRRDRSEILALWDRNLADHGVPEGRFDWIYQNSPYGQPTCFLVKHDQNGSVAGSYTLFPRVLSVNGRPVKAHVCGDLIVDTEHRSLGPAVLLVEAALNEAESESSVLFGFPNHLSQPVLLYCGFDVLCDYLEVTMVLRSYPYISRYVKVPLAARALSCPADFLLRCRPARWTTGNRRNFYCDVVASFDDQFDLFWEKMKSRFSLKGEANSRYMDWRFTKSPYEKHFIFTVSSRSDNELVGYIVFRRNGKRVQVVDIGYLPEDNYLELIFSAFYQYLAPERAEAVVFGFAGDQQLVERLQKKGFSIRCRDLKTIIYAPVSQKGIVEEIDNGHWCLTYGDNDI